MRRLLIAIALLFAHAAVAGDFEDGIAAFIREDYATALIKLRSAAQQGNVDAQYFVADIYYFGRGVAQDYKEAVRWYQLAAKQGDSQSQSMLGFMYLRGHGVEQDYKDAVRWFRLAAQQGNLEAQYNLGRMYWIGRGIAEDRVKAYMWCNIAAIAGDKESVKIRDVIARVMSPQQIKQAQRMARECTDSNFKKCD